MTPCVTGSSFSNSSASGLWRRAIPRPGFWNRSRVSSTRAKAPEASARREAAEEAGLALGDLHFVARYYPSPGGVSQVLFSYVGIADLPDEAAGLGGHAEEDEDILGHVIGFDQAMELMEKGDLVNAPAIVSLQWLAVHRDRLRKGRPRVLSLPGRTPIPWSPDPLRERPRQCRFMPDLAAAVGNTPLIRLRKVLRMRPGAKSSARPSSSTPGQSVKDRAALFIIRDAVAGARCAPVARSLRDGGQHRNRIGAGRRVDGVPYRHRDPRNAEPGEEGHDPPRGRGTRRGACGALFEPEQLREVFRPSGRAAGAVEPNGAIWANQFDNTANRQAHVETTGPEIWEQTEGGVHGFTCAVGSGGTLAAWPRCCSPGA
jgi:hypothetical protein